HGGRAPISAPRSGGTRGGPAGRGRNEGCPRRAWGRSRARPRDRSRALHRADGTRALRARTPGCRDQRPKRAVARGRGVAARRRDRDRAGQPARRAARAGVASAVRGVRARGRRARSCVRRSRPLPAVQRAYFYVVLLVAIHMIVLGVANLLRVGAEIALGAPSGGFTGLPFVFAEFSRPREQYREQASLAIALLLVAVPAWYLHYRAADAAARRSLVERGSALRSAYLQIVVLVTALLVFGYGQRVLFLVLQAALVGDST